MAGQFVRSRDRAREKESRAEAVSNLRLLRAEGMAGAKMCRTTAGQHRPGISGAASRLRAVEKGNQSAGKNGGSRSVVTIELDGTEPVSPGIASHAVVM